MYNTTLRHVHASIVALEKQLSITYSERLIVALVMHHASWMKLDILSHVASLDSFSLGRHITLSHKWHKFQIKLLNITSLFWFSLKVLYETFHIVGRKELSEILS
jgi:hypothetical protein